MAIDKITPTRLDRSSDFKLIPSTSMVDALNLIVTEDESGSGGDNVGDLGVLKNVKGNSAIQFHLDLDAILPGEAKIIGSVTDSKLKIVYFFVWHEKPNEHGVWAYDPYGKLPGETFYTNRIRKIHKSGLYKFSQHGFVKGDLIYTSQSRIANTLKKTSEFDKDTILYFTDNVNEPKKINVSAAITAQDGAYNASDKIDFVTACPKTPLYPITFEFNSDSSRSVSNFKSGPGFQFAYQAIYKDGVESAISTYSDIAFSPSILNSGTQLPVNHLYHNRCVLKIPFLGAEISSVRILARELNNPELVIIDQLDWNDNNNEVWNPNTGLYNFYNDRIVKGVSANEVNKQFDNLPRVAQAQAVVDNRLMYGNYLEGFNNLTTECSYTIDYKDREAEMVDFYLTLIPAVSEQQRAYSQEYTGSNPEDSAINKSAGYILEGTDLPSDIAPGTTINVEIKVAPNQNFHIYQAANSYHQSRHKGGFNQYLENDIDYSDPDTYNGSPWGLPDEEGSITEPYGHQSLNASGGRWLKDTVQGSGLVMDAFNALYGIPFSGDNFGVGGAGGSGDTGGINGGEGFGPIAPVWKTELGSESGTQKSVKYGTSAANPLILQGQQLIFSCSFTMGGSAGAGKEAVLSIVADLLGGREPTWGGGVESGFLNINNVQRTFSYDIDLDINNGDQYAEGDAVTKMITAVMEKTDTYNPYATPLGYFVINRAKVTFSLERDQFWRDTTEKHQMLRLVVDEIESRDDDSSIDLVTMVRKMWMDQPWQAITKDYLIDGDFSSFNNIFETTTIHDTHPTQGWHPPLSENVLEDFSYDYDTALNEWWGGGMGVFISGQQEFSLQPSIDGYTQLKKQRFLGYLDFSQGEGLDNFFRFNRNTYSQTTLNQGESEVFPFSLLDGEGGPGGIVGEDGSVAYGSEAEAITGNFASIPMLQEIPPFGYSSVPRRMSTFRTGVAFWLNTGGVPFMGTINTHTSRNLLLQQNVVMAGTPGRSFLPLMQGPNEDESLSNPSTQYWPYSNSGDFNLSFSNKHPQIEVLDSYLFFSISGAVEGGAYNRTFKSSANHDFGIIYYDERGRHGFVNHLKTVYVPGYSQQERGVAAYGRSCINLNIGHAPPDWAYYWKIAYTKNTSVQNFMQYSAGGAFLAPENSASLVQVEKIYVSLNYLQKSPISYVADWGARNPEGGLSMFKKIDGVSQKLRIISSYDLANSRSYFYNYEFDIIDIVLLGNTDNPLASDTDIVNKPWLQGEFVVLKNNPSALNFDYASILNENHYWATNCIVELYTPSRFQEEDERFYYEIGDTYETYRDVGNIYHSGNDEEGGNPSTSVTLYNGDVWWRKIPVNFREYDDGNYPDLIQINEENAANPSSSNFKSYYLETETASDLFKADASLIGRPNLIIEDAVETRREASITYSGKSNPNSSKINYSSFNLTLSNFKDLQQEFGDINYMCNISGDVFVIQSDKCTLVPASKTQFSDVQGGNTVAASKSPLGQERVFAGRSGCDNNPESAVQVGSYVYFAHKTLAKVFRFNPSEGVE